MVNEFKVLTIGRLGNVANIAVTRRRTALPVTAFRRPERRDDNPLGCRDGSGFPAKPSVFGAGLRDLNRQPAPSNPFKNGPYCVPSRRDGGENGPRLARISDMLSGRNPTDATLERRYRTRYQGCRFGSANHPAGNTPSNGTNCRRSVIRPSVTSRIHKLVVAGQTQRCL
jgi:hypothetical protein